MKSQILRITSLFISIAKSGCDETSTGCTGYSIPYDFAGEEVDNSAEIDPCIFDFNVLERFRNIEKAPSRDHSQDGTFLLWIRANTSRQNRRWRNRCSSNTCLVEPRGIEPLSESNLERTSPGAVCYLHSLVRTGTNTLTDVVASLCMVHAKLSVRTCSPQITP